MNLGLKLVRQLLVPDIPDRYEPVITAAVNLFEEVARLTPSDLDDMIASRLADLFGSQAVERLKEA